MRRLPSELLSGAASCCCRPDAHEYVAGTSVTVLWLGTAVAPDRVILLGRHKRTRHWCIAVRPAPDNEEFCSQVSSRFTYALPSLCMECGRGCCGVSLLLQSAAVCFPWLPQPGQRLTVFSRS